MHENLIPFRQKGKGSKRLASIAIQSAIVQMGGIMMIDEIEQGQEPDRIKQAVRSLQENQGGQIILATHSRDAICELGPTPLVLLLKNDFTDEITTKKLDSTNENLKKTIRACSEAFFAKKIIICEGATEVGICRSLDKWRIQNQKQPMAFNDCDFVDGTGSTLEVRVDEISNVGLKTSLFCDSDCKKINDRKEDWRNKGILVLDCEKDFCLEKQVFQDLPWVALLELIDCVISNKYKDEDRFLDAINAKLPNGSKIDDKWRNSDYSELREAFYNASTIPDKEWFKSITNGEVLGNVLFKHFENIEVNTRIKRNLMDLSTWVEN